MSYILANSLDFVTLKVLERNFVFIVYEVLTLVVISYVNLYNFQGNL